MPTLERPGWAGTPVEDLGLEISTWSDGQDPYDVLAALLPSGARVLSVDYYMPSVHALGCAVGRSRLGTHPGRGDDRRTADAQGPRRDRRVAGGGGGDRPGAAADRGVAAAGRTEHEVAADIAAAHGRGGARRRRVRHRRVRTQRRQPAPRGVGPGDRRGRAGRRRHRRSQPRRLLLRLHPHLRDRSGRPGRRRRGLRDRPDRAAGRGRGRRRRGHLRIGRRGGPAGHRRCRLRRVLHHPHRPRHRPRGPRAPVPGARQHQGVGAGNGVLRRTRHLPAGPVRRAHRGHRRRLRRRAAPAEHLSRPS